MDFNDPTTWVRVALGLFIIVLVVMGVPGSIWKSLGDTGKAVRAELDEAVRIRQEAQDLLNRIKQERQAAELKAKELVSMAEEEAKMIAQEAKIKLKETIARRQAQAEAKIAQAQSQAESQVKSAAADLASQMAEAVLSHRVASLGTDASLDVAIKQIDNRLA